MLIRPATIHDALAIAKVLVDTWRTTYTGIFPAEFLATLSYDERATRLRELIRNEEDENRFLLVAEDEAEGVIGFTGGGKERSGDAQYKGELYSFFVLAAHQQKGIGRKLIAAGVEQLLEMGFDSMLIWCIESNPSCRFYERMGGTRVRQRQVEVSGKEYSEIGYGWDDFTLSKISVR